MRELFDVKSLRQPLTVNQRLAAAKKIISAAKFGIKYSYKLKEAAGILHWSSDQIFDAVKFYKIDAIQVLGMIRIPWWALAEYLIDPADDVEKMLAQYVNSLPHKSIK